MFPRILQTILWTLLFTLSGCQSAPDAQPVEIPTLTGRAVVATVTPEAVPTQGAVQATAAPVATATAAVLESATPLPATPSATGVSATEIPPSLPIRLSIPEIELNVAIESVGNDGTGKMDVPQAVENAAWWNPGPLPGAPGNAVISGHLDTYLQEPAAFWRLRELEQGDEIVVRDARGVDHRFEVVNSAVYAHDQVPLDIIFGDAVLSRPNLILITCEGLWDSDARNYDERFVVYAKHID